MGTQTVHCDIGGRLPDGPADVESGVAFVGDILAEPVIEQGRLRFPVAVGTDRAVVRVPGSGSVAVTIAHGDPVSSCSDAALVSTESGVHITAELPAGDDVLHTLRGACFVGGRGGPTEFFKFATTGPCTAWLEVNGACGPIEGPSVDFEVVDGTDAVIELTGPTRAEVESCAGPRDARSK